MAVSCTFLHSVLYTTVASHFPNRYAPTRRLSGHGASLFRSPTSRTCLKPSFSRFRECLLGFSRTFLNASRRLLNFSSSASLYTSNNIRREIRQLSPFCREIRQTSSLFRKIYRNKKIVSRKANDSVLSSCERHRPKFYQNPSNGISATIHGNGFHAVFFPIRYILVLPARY